MMTRLPFALWTRLLALAGICSLFLAAAPKSLASSEDNTGNALEAAKAWMAKIDAGDYEASYQAGSSVLHDTVTQDKWLLVMKALRTTWGDVVSRRVTSHIYKPDGYEKQSGEFMIISYDTSFKNLPVAQETVILRRENG